MLRRRRSNYTSNKIIAPPLNARSNNAFDNSNELLCQGFRSKGFCFPSATQNHKEVTGRPRHNVLFLQ